MNTDSPVYMDTYFFGLTLNHLVAFSFAYVHCSPHNHSIRNLERESQNIYLTNQELINTNQVAPHGWEKKMGPPKPK